MLLCAVSLFIAGCSAKEVVVYRNVSVPVSCKVDIPDPPHEWKGTALTFADYVEYSKLMRIELERCK